MRARIHPERTSGHPLHEQRNLEWGSSGLFPCKVTWGELLIFKTSSTNSFVWFGKKASNQRLRATLEHGHLLDFCTSSLAEMPEFYENLVHFWGLDVKIALRSVHWCFPQTIGKLQA